MSRASSPVSLTSPSLSLRGPSLSLESTRSGSIPPSSTAPSSPPPPHEVLESSPVPEEEEEERVKGDDGEKIFEDEETERRFKRLQFVLEKSAVYSSILKERMEEDREEQKKEKEKAEQDARKAAQKSAGRKRGRVNGILGEEEEQRTSKRVRGETGEPVVVVVVDGEEREEVDEDEDEAPIFDQPKLVTGGRLKSYQLEGLQWMVSLDQNGISGILADEMGLGKTLQVIAFSAYLREHQNYKPFLIVCPLSVLHNWIDEYQKFAPKIPVCMYHGTPAERAELRSTVMAWPKPAGGRTAKAKSKSKAKAKPKPKASTAKKAKTDTKSRTTARRSKRGTKSNVIDITSDSENGGANMSEKEEDHALKAWERFPIVVTTYEMIIKDRAALSHYEWGYIVVDEGHRLKNLDCRLMKEIKKYQSAGRMILTGTPLHNNLAELWSLLNFVLPDIFDDVDAFQTWFNLPMMQNLLGYTRSTQLINALHVILKPFLLRRLKGDVEMRLPPKKEYVIYAPLTVRQREAYQYVPEGRMREWLISGGAAAHSGVNGDIMKTKRENEGEGEGKRRLRSEKRARKRYADVDGDDDKYFEMVERGDVDERGALKSKRTGKEEEKEDGTMDIGREWQYQSALKQVNNMRLQNAIMQLRKVCSHPFLFEWPLDPKTHELVLGKELVSASGKMMVLDRLLRELFRRKEGHRVLLFSQFTTMLDIIEAWATDYMGWPVCRIDGSTPPEERRAEMGRFQQAGKDSPRLFLLSTRAGGLGINLTAADTVIFYDQDWNPQMDAQAQDRAHRIGQTKPVLIFRLVSAHTIETKIMERATEKRKLEALVIAKGKFKTPAALATEGGLGGGKGMSMAEMAAALLKLESDKIEVVPPPTGGEEGKYVVLSDEELDMLLDRRPGVFSERVKGWTNVDVGRGGTGAGAGARGETRTEDRMEVEKKGEGEVVEKEGKRTAFAVYEGLKDAGNVNDALAKMLGEDVE
ncbi:hypothetical protein AX17_006855 [Amanita inopinata Kibby_2008]|nr:hypothetical protein AX17_006855 [Amanita inopinata Kibby_2008]